MEVFNSYLRYMLPNLLIQSLQTIKGFDQEAFEKVHASGEQVVSIRIHPEKWHKVNLPTSGDQYAGLPIQSSVPWCGNGYYLTERPSFTFDPLFHAGAYYVQEASSMFLWHVLEQSVGKTTQLKVLDLCAAPGGKSTLLSSYFTDGLVVANEVIKSRAAILTENVTKWGSDNIIVTNNDPNDFQRLQNYFDVVVVDAPCSGSGLFRKDPNAINEWSEENVNLCSLRQQRILADILPALKENGVLIYSTCSYSKQEDEDLLDWMIASGKLETVDCHPNANWNIVETISPIHQANGYRFYPDKVKGEGFFIAVFKKIKGGEETKLKEQVLTLPSKQELIQVGSFVSLPASYQLFKQNDNFRAIKENWLQELKYLAKHLYIKKAGVELGSIKGKDFIPSHELAVSVLPIQSFEMIELTEQQALQYLRKKEVVAEAAKGWCRVGYCGLPLGWVKVLPNRINNYYPSEWRILKD